MSLLPIAPSTLCFDKNEFMKDEFSVDHFVADCRRRVQLETLRQDLEIYFKVLKNAMIELINKDYADFVNLSSNLVGMNKAIELLREPLSKMKLDVGVRCDNKHIINLLVEDALELQRGASEKRSLLSHMKGLLQAVDKIEHIQRSDDSNTGQVLERIAGEFNQLQHHATFCKALPVLNHIRPRISDVTSSLQSGLEDELVRGVAGGDTRAVHRCLNSYALIGKTRDAENLVRAHVVQPCLHEIMEEHGGDASLNKLKQMFNKILEFVPSQLKMLCDITSGRQNQLGDQFRGIPGYDFMVNSAWPEIVMSLEKNIPELFASGDPDTFHKRYKLCMEFVSNYERQCGSQGSITRLRQSEAFNTLLTHWSLPVYFQIRQVLLLFSEDLALSSGNDQTFRLKSSTVLWKCVERCWKDGVFLPSLLHRFWKLTLQLLSRYNAWIVGVKSEQVDFTLKTTSPRFDVAAGVFPLGKVAELILDIDAIVNKINAFYLDQIQPKVLKQGLKETDILQRALDQACTELTAHKDDLIKHIVTSLSSQSIAYLKQAQDVPRLFRKTNRPSPTDPSTYVNHLMKPIADFYEEQVGFVDATLLSHWLTQVATPVTDRFHQVVSEVLTSVRKMEESLIRLQKMRSGGKSSSGNLASLAGLSDDDKIRLQLFIDVTSFGKQMSDCGANVTEIPIYQKLLHLVEEAK
uniref:Conserved oligomeric Golgi complex subunit 2 n=1 Tax=Ciona savignyi TaxID=51511 RepID=H2YCH7_CIOSA